MKKLKEIKKYKDKYCTNLMLKEVNLIKRFCNISKNKRVYIIGKWNNREYFLSENKVYVAKFSLTDKKDLTISSLYLTTLKDNNIVDFKTVISDSYTKEEFIAWYNSPSTTTEMVDVANSRAIKFLQSYKKNKFKTENYPFYVKRDKDYTLADNLYAYDIKNKIEMKLYFNSYIETFTPLKEKDIFVEIISGKLSKYQIRKCKKEFITFLYHQKYLVITGLLITIILEMYETLST